MLMILAVGGSMCICLAEDLKSPNIVRPSWLAGI